MPSDIRNTTTVVPSEIHLIVSPRARQERDHERDERRQEHQPAQEDGGIGKVEHGRRIQRFGSVSGVVNDQNYYPAMANLHHKRGDDKQHDRADDDEHHVLPQLAGLHRAQRQA